MKLSEKQQEFSLDFAKLITWINTLPGYKARIDEVKRPIDTQRQYVKSGKSKTMKSQHLNRLAGDLIIDYKGKYIAGNTKTEKELLRIIGEKWESMRTKNRWGGRFGVKKADYDKKIGWDAGHFERL